MLMPHLLMPRLPRLCKTLARALYGSARIGLAAPLFSLLTVSASFGQAPPLPAFQETAKSANFKDGKVMCSVSAEGGNLSDEKKDAIGA